MLLSSLKSFIQTHRNKGRGEAFGFDDVTTETYLKWAFSLDYLFVVHNDNEISGVGIAYPINHKSDKDSLFTFNSKIAKDKEHLHDLCIMDLISINSDSTKSLVKQFKLRYPHWNACKKWALRFGEIKEITNKYLNIYDNGFQS
jgi:hypothetical protein